MASVLSIVLIATLLGSLALAMVLCLRISGQCSRVVRIARIASEAEAITRARRIAMGAERDSSSPPEAY